MLLWPSAMHNVEGAAKYSIQKEMKRIRIEVKQDDRPKRLIATLGDDELIDRMAAKYSAQKETESNKTNASRDW